MAKIAPEDMKSYTLVKTVLNPLAKVSVSGTVVVKDEAGNEWAVPFAYFGFEMKPYCEAQPNDYSEWLTEVMHAKCVTWSTTSYTQEELFAAYRSGKSPDDLYPPRARYHG